MSERFIQEARKEFHGLWKLLLISFCLGIFFGLAFKQIIPHLWGEIPSQEKKFPDDTKN